jgi:hypothetical protein
MTPSAQRQAAYRRRQQQARAALEAELACLRKRLAAAEAELAWRRAETQRARHKLNVAKAQARRPWPTKPVKAPKAGTLAARPWSVRKAENEAVEHAEDEFIRQWHRRGLGKPGYRLDEYSAGLAEARKHARAEFRARQAREQAEILKARPELPSHIRPLDKPPAEFLDLEPGQAPAPIKQ